MSVMVCVAGDVMLDILVSTQGPLRVDDDTSAVGGLPDSLSADAVVKRGSLGATFVVGGVQTSLGIVPGPVADVTGAGDALAAGYFVGGPEMAIAAAARCISRMGAQPLI